MKAEIRLQYRTDLESTPTDYTEFVEVLCPTELSNTAYKMLKQSGADNVNFAFIQE